jgi:hypothetical protein
VKEESRLSTARGGYSYWEHLAYRTRRRDKYTCKKCGNRRGRLIVQYKTPPIPREVIDEDSLQTVCEPCHLASYPHTNTCEHGTVEECFECAEVRNVISEMQYDEYVDYTNRMQNEYRKSCNSSIAGCRCTSRDPKAIRHPQKAMAAKDDPPSRQRASTFNTGSSIWSLYDERDNEGYYTESDSDYGDHVSYEEMAMCVSCGDSIGVLGSLCDVCKRISE